MPDFGIGEAIAGGGALLGGIMGGQKSGGKTQTSETAPWGPQQSYMLNGFSQAKTNMADRTANPLPEGPWVAPTNTQQTNANDAIYSTGMGAPVNFANWTGVGNTLAGNVGDFSSNARDLATNGIGNRDPGLTALMNGYALTGHMPGSPTVNRGLTNGVTNASMGSLGSLGDARTAANGVATAGMDPSRGSAFALDTANQFANNPTIDGMIDASNRDIGRTLNEDTIRGIRTAGMATGNANSSREAALEGIATRGAADRMADNSAAIRGAAYTNGLNTGASLYSTGLNSTLNAASALNANGGTAGVLAGNELGRETQANQFGTSSRLGAATSSNTADLGFGTANASARLGGNAQIGNGLTTGMAATGAGLSGSLAGLDAARGAGTFTQDQAQRQITDALNRWNAGDTRNTQILNDYWNIVGRPVGQSSTQTQQPSGGGIGGALAGAFGGLSAGAGFAKNFGFLGGGGSIADIPFD